MSPRMLALAVVFLLAALADVMAQATTSAVCSSSYNWANNKIGQSPCLVASHLESVCNGGLWDVAALVPDSEYAGGGTSSCQCNMVVYSLISACGACQGHNYVDWSVWSKNCPQTYIEFPENIPSNTSIPKWARAPLDTVKWNETLARQIAGVLPSSSSSVSVPITSSLSTFTEGSTSSSANGAEGTTTPAVSPSHARLQIGVLVGSLVGSVTLLAALVGLVFFWRRRGKHVNLSDQLASHHDPETARMETEQISERSEASTMRSPRSLSVINVPAAQSLGPYGPYLGRAVSPGSTAHSRPSTSNSQTQYPLIPGQKSLRLPP